MGLTVTPGPMVASSTLSWESIYHFVDSDDPETGPFSMLVEVIEGDTGEIIASGSFLAASHASNLSVAHQIQISNLTPSGQPIPGTTYLIRVELDPEETVAQCSVTTEDPVENDIAQVELIAG